MSWKTWSLKEWNAALVEAVFLVNGRAGSTISRIEANARFLAKCTDDADCDPEEAKASFVRSFGTSASTIRDLFKWPSTRPLPRGQDIPKSFASLYITLMAGSADDETYEIGMFRRRFVELFAPTVRGAESNLNLPFSDLPAMWSYVARWSEDRQRQLGDCGILKLPKVPDSERLIGCSKRIAFPTFKDEVKLKKLLEECDLSANSEFRRVVTAVRSRADQFSAGFINEFDSFSRQVSQHRLQEAYDSRFWGVIRDISLDEPGVGAGRPGKYCLQLDVGDPYEPVPYLFVDDTGRDRIAPALQTLPVLRRDGLRFVASAQNGYPSMDSLVRMMRTPKAATSKVGKFCQAGWITFLPDPLGVLSTDGEHSEEAQVGFLMKRSFANALADLLKHLGINYTKLETGSAISGWIGFLCNSVSRSGLNRILATAPPSIARLSRTGWSPPRVTLSGGAWDGQALLLSPASNPVAYMPGAVRGSFRLLDADGVEIYTGGPLEVAGEGFRADPVQLKIFPPNAHFCEYTLQGEGKEDKHLRVYLARTLPNTRPIELRSTGSWRCEGSSGILQPIALEGVELFASRPTGAGLPTTRFPPKAATGVEPLPAWTFADVAELPRALSWVADALLLRFQSCGTMAFAQLMDHISGVAVVEQLPAQMIRRLLIEGQWLLPVQRVGVPIASVAAAPRLATAKEAQGVVCMRVTGMLGTADFAAINANLISNEVGVRLASGPLSLGCLELRLSSFARVQVFANLLGARLVKRQEVRPPLAALAPNSTHMVLTEPPYHGARMEPWLPDVRNWGQAVEIEQPWPTGQVRRLAGANAHKGWYWLRAHDSSFVKTDSLAWAWLAAEAVTGRPIAKLLPSGEVVWPRRLAGLPPALSRWWLLFGGGCIAFGSLGQTYFTGPAHGDASRAMGLRAQAASSESVRENRALAHRDLALRMVRANAVSRHRLLETGSSARLEKTNV